MRENELKAAAAAATDPNGPPVIAAYVCEACAHVHLAVIKAGKTMVTVGMTSAQGAALAFEINAAAGAAFVGHTFLSTPRIEDGMFMLSCIGGGVGQVVMAIGEGPRPSFTLALNPELTKGLARNVTEAVEIAVGREREAAAAKAALDERHGHDHMAATVAQMVDAIREQNGAADGLISVGCPCGSVHLFPIRQSKADGHLTLDPGVALGLAADLSRSAAEARRLAEIAAVNAADGASADPAPASKLH